MNCYTWIFKYLRLCLGIDVKFAQVCECVCVCEREEGGRNRETERLKGRKPYLLTIGQICTRDKGIVKMRLVLKDRIDVLKKRKHSKIRSSVSVTQ